MLGADDQSWAYPSQKRSTGALWISLRPELPIGATVTIDGALAGPYSSSRPDADNSECVELSWDRTIRFLRMHLKK